MFTTRYNLKNDNVKSLVYVCLAGNAAKDILKDNGIVVGIKLAKEAIKKISGKTVPIVGGVIGGAVDSVVTNTIGNIARDTFIGKKDETKY